MFKETKVNSAETLITDKKEVKELLKSIFDDLYYEDESILNMFFDINFFIEKYVFSLNYGLVFFHNGKKYTYGQTEEGSIMLGECVNFFKTYSQLKESINNHKRDLPWLHTMDLERIWKRSTLSDLADPTIFLKRITAEIENGGLEIKNWTDIGDIETRKGMQKVIAKDIPSQYHYIEGPRTLQFSVINDADTESNTTDSIHSVVYGLDGHNMATIYSVMLDPIEGISEGRIENTKNGMIDNIQIINGIETNKKEELCNLVRVGKFDELEQELIRINKDTPIKDDQNYDMYNHLTDILELLKKDVEISLTINTRQENLKRFNKISGGASMVSFLSTLAIMKKRGVDKINIPIYMPHVAHVLPKDTSIDELNANITNSWLQKIQSLIGFSKDINVIDDESSILIDISNWNIDFSRINKKNRQLVPLLEGILNI